LHADGAASLLRDAELRRALEWKARVEPTPAWASQYDGQFDLVMRFLDESLAEQCEDLADVEVARRWQIRRRVVAGLCVLGFIVSALVVAVIVSVSTAFQPGAKDVFIGLLVPVWLGAYPVLSGIAQRRYHRRTRPGIVASLIAAGGQIEPPSVSPRVYRLARWGAWTAGVAGAVYALGSVLFAWTANRDFAQRVESASARVTKSMSANASRSAVMSFPSGEDLRGLSDLRDVLERLDSYQSAGPPLRLRWGMWRGDVLLREGRRVWFDGYRAMLHDRAFGAIVDSLRGLPDAPRPDDDYLERYGWLKTYLIITRNPDRTDVDLLRSVLLREWRRDRRIDPDAAHRAGDQFEFYARELRRASPWETPEDAAVVARARKFLSAFGGLERLYQLMLERVATSAPSVRLAFVAPRTEGVVIAPRDVSHAFTPSGWDFMRDLFTKVNPFVGADRWVLGEENDAAKGTDNLKAQLQRRYREDYALAWRRYLQSLSVARAGALEDEIKQLSVLSSVPSPLLLALDVLSRSMPDDSTLASEFRPVTFLVTLNANAQKASPAAPYINALSELRDALGRADSLLLAGRVSPPVLDGAVRQAQIKEAEARIAAKGLMAPFVADPTTADAARLVASLLIAPIEHADEALQAARRAVRM
jgi:Uncharacterized protein conserved in bacteria